MSEKISLDSSDISTKVSLVYLKGVQLYLHLGI